MRNAEKSTEKKPAAEDPEVTARKCCAKRHPLNVQLSVPNGVRECVASVARRTNAIIPTSTASVSAG